MLNRPIRPAGWSRGILEKLPQAAGGQRLGCRRACRRSATSCAGYPVGVGDEAMPAVEQVELDRHPVLAVPGRAFLKLAGSALELEVVRRDVVDVLLDHDLDQQHDQDVAGGLEEPVVVPARVLRRPAARATRLCSRKNSTFIRTKPSWRLAVSLPTAKNCRQLFRREVGPQLGAGRRGPWRTRAFCFRRRRRA